MYNGHIWEVRPLLMWLHLFRSIYPCVQWLHLGSPVLVNVVTPIHIMLSLWEILLGMVTRVIPGHLKFLIAMCIILGT